MDVDLSSPSESDTNVLFTLRADRNLLDPTFDRYILRTERLAMCKRKMDEKIRYKLPSDSQWGYQQIRAHTLASHLFFDHFASSDSQQVLFAFLDDLRLISLNFNTNASGLCHWSDPVQVAHIGTSAAALSPSIVPPSEDDASAQSFPESLHFVDSCTAITSRGLNAFSVWDTGDRRPKEKEPTKVWRKVFHCVLPPLHQLDAQKGIDNGEGVRVGNASVYPSLILDARQTPPEVQGVSNADYGMDVLLMTVEPRVEEKNGEGEGQTVAEDDGGAAKRPDRTTPEDKSAFRTYLIWATVRVNEPSCADVKDGSNFAVQRIRQILCDGKVEFACFDASSPHRLVVFGVGSAPKFVWDSARPLTEQQQKGEGTDGDESMEGVVQQQSEGEEQGRKAFGGGVAAEKIAEEIDNVQPSAAGDAQQQFNAEQLEECDRLPDVEDDVSAFWLDGDSHQLVAMTIVNELLFTQKFSPNGAPVFATRYDVDTVVWQHAASSPSGQNKDFVNHLFTLNAFGYIQAGHQDKRFLGCSPDGRYATLINRINHCFLYFQNSAVPSEHQLKNRRTGKQAEHIAKQLVLSMSDLDKEFDPNESSNEFIAFHATADTLFLLTPSAIYAVSMPK